MMKIRRLRAKTDFLVIEQLWNELYTVENDYFLSWNWIKNFIEIYNEIDDILFSHVILGNNEVIYLTINNGTKYQKWNLLSYVTQITINSSIDRESSIPTPEFISLLHRGFVDDNQVINCVLSSLPKSDVVYINFSSIEYLGNLKYKYKKLNQSLVYKVLNNQIDDFSSYINFLNKKTRYSIKFSEKYYIEKYGSINLKSLTDKDDIYDSISFLKRQSIERHSKIGKKSSFENINFVNFINVFINNSLQDIAILKITAGEKTLGVMIFFIDGFKARFYQCGFSKEVNKKVSTGMLCNYLAIKYFHENNYSEYNFLAGNAMYKRLLSNNVSYLYNYAFYLGAVGKLLLIYNEFKFIAKKFLIIGKKHG